MVLASRSRLCLTSLAALAALLLLAPGLLPAQEGLRWRPLGPWGGTVTGITIHPTNPQILYAAGPLPGVVRSTDGGGSWKLLPGSPFTPAFVTIDPAKPSTLYAGQRYAGQVFKSTNSGASWRRISNGLPEDLDVLSLATDPSKPSRLYLGSPLGIWKSENGGASWQRANRGLPVHGNVYAVTFSVPRQPAGTAYVNVYPQGFGLRGHLAEALAGGRNPHGARLVPRAGRALDGHFHGKHPPQRRRRSDLGEPERLPGADLCWRLRLRPGGPGTRLRRRLRRGVDDGGVSPGSLPATLPGRHAGPGRDRGSLPLDRGGPGLRHALLGSARAFRGNGSGTRLAHPALRGSDPGTAPPVPEGLGHIILPVGHIAALPTPLGKPRGKDPRGGVHIAFSLGYIARCRGPKGKRRGSVSGKHGQIARSVIYIAETRTGLPRSRGYIAELQGYMARRPGAGGGRRGRR